MSIFVYVAGPLSGPAISRNVLAAIDTANFISELGAQPFVPHLFVLWNFVHPRRSEDWMALDFAWLEKCDALFRIPGDSPGADREVARARELGLPVFDRFGELSEWIESRKSESHNDPKSSAEQCADQSPSGPPESGGSRGG